MGKRWWTFEHPADVGLAARADDLAGLFEALGEGLARQICPGGVRADKSIPVRVEADDLESLAVEFLAGLVRLFELERFLVGSVHVVKIADGQVVAAAAGEAYDPARHQLGAEIKAVTYHQVRVAREDGGWTARVILDV